MATQEEALLNLINRMKDPATTVDEMSLLARAYESLSNSLSPKNINETKKLANNNLPNTGLYSHSNNANIYPGTSSLYSEIIHNGNYILWLSSSGTRRSMIAHIDDLKLRFVDDEEIYKLVASNEYGINFDMLIDENGDMRAYFIGLDDVIYESIMPLSQGTFSFSVATAISTNVTKGNGICAFKDDLGNSGLAFSKSNGASGFDTYVISRAINGSWGNEAVIFTDVGDKEGYVSSNALLMNAKVYFVISNRRNNINSFHAMFELTWGATSSDFVTDATPIMRSQSNTTSPYNFQYTKLYKYDDSNIYLWHRYANWSYPHKKITTVNFASASFVSVDSVNIIDNPTWNFTNLFGYFDAEDERFYRNNQLSTDWRNIEYRNFYVGHTNWFFGLKNDRFFFTNDGSLIDAKKYVKAGRA